MDSETTIQVLRDAAGAKLSQKPFLQEFENAKDEVFPSSVFASSKSVYGKIVKGVGECAQA